MNLSYKSKFLSIYLVVVTLMIILIGVIFNYTQSNDVSNISIKNFQNKTLERKEFIEDYLYPYFSALESIASNETFNDYINHKENEISSLNLFLTMKKSLPCATHVRYINTNGDEKLRVEGTPLSLYKDKAISKIVPTKKLQNKATRGYFKKFVKLNKGEVGLSFIDLNKEHGKVTLPKQPTLRIATSIYNKLNQKKGIVIINICLRKFFSLLNKTTLYNVYIIDKEGKFLNFKDNKAGLISNNFDLYTIKDHFNSDWKQILNKKSYFSKNYYSSTLKQINNNQGLKIILELKYDKISKENTEKENTFLFILVIVAFLFLPVIVYFSKLPDKLILKSKKDLLLSKLTKLPNRVALMEDLNKSEYESSIVILISIKNIIKIQNTYGYEISNELLKKVSRYLLEYDKDNKHIQKIYMNSYNIFSIKYRYTTKENLRNFLNKILADMENHIFSIEDTSMEFALDICLGVSNPLKINNNVEELQEAENALDTALEKSLSIDIYDSTHDKNRNINKNNIHLAKQIKKAIDNNNIVIHFQPIYNNHTEKIEKYESLIRMKTEDSLIYPDTFLPIAKQINKYNTLSYIVIDKSFKYFKDKEFEFSVNLSILDVSNTHFQEYLFERIEYYGIKDKLVLEIVESEGIDNYDEFFKFIKDIKKIGCKIAIDDFGSGYSNFEYIIKLSDYIDYLKIDGTLVKNITTDSKTQVLVGSLKFLCDNLNIKTIAEYVEDKETLNYLSSIGIDYSQGYFIGKAKEEILD